MRSTVTAISIGALACASCLLHRPTRDPAPAVELPAGYDDPSASAGAPMPEQWWTAFGDPQLSALVDRALAGNFQVKAAWARLRQAHAVARQAGAARWPQLSASIGAERRKNRFDFGDMVIEPKVTQYSLSASASYEVDVWRRADAGARAGALGAIAARDDVEAMAISVAAEVAEAWFDVLEQRELRALLTEQLETTETFLELVTLRFREGLASASEVYQQRQQVANLRARLELVEAIEQVHVNRLSILVGVPPGALSVGEAAVLPSLPALPGTGVPGDLLLRRPDLRGWQRRVEAADWRVAVAIADRFPLLRITGSTGVQSSSLGDLLQTPIWSIGASLLAAIFDGGRLKAEVERNRGVVDELVAGYAHATLGALVEVDNALVQERQQLAHIAALETSVDLGRNALRDARERYREGLTDYLPVLTSLVNVHGAEQSLLSARRRALSYRIQLCRALGGTWTRELAAAESPAGGKS